MYYVKVAALNQSTLLTLQESRYIGSYTSHGTLSTSKPIQNYHICYIQQYHCTNSEVVCM